MAIGKPKVKIKDFSGAGDSGVYYLENFAPKEFNGQTVLTQSYNPTNYLNGDTASFTDLEGNIPRVMTNFAVDVDGYSVLTDQLGAMYCFHNDTSASHIGKIHLGATSGALAPIAYPGLLMNSSGSLLYSSANHLGVGFIGQVKTGSTSTLIIDKAGRDVTTFGAGTTTGINKIYNLTQKEEFTVTSITDQDATKDGFNFTAGSTTPAENDYYMFFVDNRFDFGTTSTANLQFKGQVGSASWERPVIFWNDAFYVLNGNFLSKLAKTESTWTSDILDEAHKQLPDNTQGNCMSYNTDRLLIGSSVNGKGRLLLWDGYAPGWINQIELDIMVTAIDRYKNGWIFLMGDTFYFTDGYTVQAVAKILDGYFGSSIGQVGANSCFKIIDNKIFFNGGIYSNGRGKFGVHVFDLIIGGWSYTPNNNGEGLSTGAGGVIHYATSQNYNSNYIFSSSTDSYATHVTNVTKISQRVGDRSSAIFFIKLPQKMKINLVELLLSPKMDYISSTVLGNNSVTVNYGDGNKVLNNFNDAGATASATVLENDTGANTPATVGQLVSPLGGDRGWERSYIASMTNAGTNNEVWTISPALSGAPNADDSVRRANLFKCGTKTVSSNNTSGELIFPVPAFYSDKMFVEVYFDCASTNANMDLLGINLY